MELSKWLAQTLKRKGGQDIIVLDVQGRSSITNFLVIATGTSHRQIETLALYPCQELKKSGHPPLSIEGENTGWILADLGDVVLHVFLEAQRRYYDLEELWNKAARVDWQEKENLHIVGF